ncbi:unnamed protein product [Colias eurytheme]|nr:unnamed protein product [Colias eurytheme]
MEATDSVDTKQVCIGKTAYLRSTNNSIGNRNGRGRGALAARVSYTALGAQTTRSTPGDVVAIPVLVQCSAMVAMVASASGYGTLRRFLSAPEGADTNNPSAVPGASVAVSMMSCSYGRDEQERRGQGWVSRPWQLTARWAGRERSSSLLASQLPT